MLDAAAFLIELTRLDVSEVVGVPCSYLTPLINRIASAPSIAYMRATQEGEALAVASGAWLAGTTMAVIGQNSGLGNMVNPLTSLNHPYLIPVPLIISWRGEPGRKDESQHQLLGRIMPELLDLMLVNWSLLSPDPECLRQVLIEGWTDMRRTRLPYAFILRQGVIRDESVDEPEPPMPVVPDIIKYSAGDRPPSRIAALTCLLEALPDSAAVISTTGKTSRELFTLTDRPQHFYLVGAMGSASAVGLGVARHTDRTVVVVDGDGAALMRLGTFATISAHPAANLVHILLDNEVHDSTGGQRTLAAQVDFAAVAAACGYAQVHECSDLYGFSHALNLAQYQTGPALVYLRISPGSLPGLGRPNLHPSEVASRFREFVTARKQ